MANEINDRPNPGGETLNDRLRRAASMAREQQERQQPPRPVQEPQPHRPAPEPRPQQAQQPRPEQPRQQPSRRRMPQVEEYETVMPPGKSKPGIGKNVIWLAVLLVLALGVIVYLTVSQTKKAAEQQQQIEQLQLANEQLQLANEYDALNNEFAQYENQTSLLANDSIVQKYSAARAQVEKLLQELKNEKNKSAAQISKLKGEIATLKGILRNYVEQINERMTLAEKLNVTGVNLVALNKKGRTEKKVTKARQLMVTFTIPQNNSTPVGEKTIFLRITNPEGALLGGGGSFQFEGASLEATARKSIEYAGEEIGGITVYWDVNTTLTPGDYTVELFCDNYRLASRKFTLK